ncbi:MAG TPA: hypothetical protein VG273_16515 [Bryobacteraceae bacterium]|jgi:hypothetical protein|nr:hypothetical protein [Bryobacteraceae bacterium]
MSAFVKSLLRNIISAASCTSGSTTTSTVRQDFLGKGIRLTITVSGATATGTTDFLYLCAVAPATPTAALPLVGFSAANMLSVNGTYFADFYPGAWLPPAVASGSKLLGIAGVNVGRAWAVQVVMGNGNSATITVDAETLP